MALAEGIYSIVSCKAPICIDLQDGTPVRVWQQTSFSGTRVYQETFPGNRCNPRPRDQLWLVRNTTAGHYSLQNLRSGTYLDLWDGNSANGTKIVGHRPMGPNGTPAANQQWEITAAGDFYRKVRNAATQTYMNLLGSYIHDGNPVHGWEYTVEEEDALWRFEWLSVTTIDIGRALSNNAHKLEGIEPFEEHDIYFVLRRDLLRDIWRSSDLATTPYRPGVFDHDAFALAYKCAVSKWCLDHIKAVGRCRAFGVVVEKQMGFAFNWTLSADLSDIIFIDPANGRTIGRDLFKSAPTLAAAAQGKFEDDNLTGFF